MIAERTGVGHTANEATYTKMTVSSPTILGVSGEVRHALLGYAELVVCSTIYAGNLYGCMETPVLQAFVSVSQLSGTIESSTVRALEVDSGSIAAKSMKPP